MHATSIPCTSDGMLATWVPLVNHTVAVSVSGQRKVSEDVWKLVRKREEWVKAFQMDAAEQHAHSQGTMQQHSGDRCFCCVYVGGKEQHG